MADYQTMGSTGTIKQLARSSPDIPTFYRGRSVFITGGTGFMGKVLVERLLTTCPEVRKLYLLIRAKKGQSPERRLHQLKQSQVFDVLRANNPIQLDKLVAVSGDVTAQELGLTHAVRTQLKEVSVVFHSAATVKLQAELKQSVEQNLRSVIKVLQLCNTLPKLDVFVHVSTAYSNAELSTVEERVYPPPMSLQSLLEAVDDENTSEASLKRLTASKPNTYTFTKAMAEHVVEQHGCHQFPIAIFRPTIVVSSMNYPFPGWIENLNGPSGVIAGVSTGLLRVLRARGSAKADMVPVDIAIDTLIAVAWETAVDKFSKVRVYNCTSKENATTWHKFTHAVNTLVPRYPSSEAILYPRLFIVNNWFGHWILETGLQTLPLHLIHYITRILGIKSSRNLLEASRSLTAMNDALEYFATRDWNFLNENSIRLRNRLSENDKILFNLDPNTINWQELLTNFIVGNKKYILKEDCKNLVGDRNRIRLLQLISNIMHIFFTLLVLSSMNCLLLKDVIHKQIIVKCIRSFTHNPKYFNLCPF